MTIKMTATEAKATILSLLDEVASGQRLRKHRQPHPVAVW